MATGWLAAARPAILPAVGIALVAVTSCVLPSYSVGGTTSGSAAGGSTSTGPGVGGTGGASQSSSDSASVGPGGSGLGGSGIGGDVTMCSGSMNGALISLAKKPHDVALSANYVYWIAENDDEVFYSPRASPQDGIALSIQNVCGISGANFQGGDQVVMRKNDGSIFVAEMPSVGMVTKVFAGTTGALDGGTCAISVAANGDDVYGFDVDNKGVYTLVKYTISSVSRQTLSAAMGTPVAIDATNDQEVVWAEALSGSGAFWAMSKATNTIDTTLGGACTDVCAYGQHGTTFAYVLPGSGVIDTWSLPDNPSYLANNAPASRIACNGSYRAWIEYGTGCATLKHKETTTGATKTIATNQPRACSIAVAGAHVYWTNCEPSGGVYTARMQ